MLEKPKRLYAFGPFILNVANYLLSCGGREIKLEPKAFELLVHFVSHPKQILSCEEIKRAVWGPDNVADSSVYRKISDVRKVLRQYDLSRDYIETLSKRGWRFAVEVTEHFESPPLDAHPATAELASNGDGPTSASPSLAAAQVRRGQTSAQLVGIAVLAFAVIAVVVLVAAEGLSRANFEPQAVAIHRLTKDARPKAGPLVSDGHYVYFSERTVDADQGPTSLAAVPAGGGSVLFPANPVDPPAMILGVAQSTQDRLYGRWRAEAGPLLFVWREKQRLLEPTAVIGGDARISPDGGAIAYAVGDRTFALIIRDLAAHAMIRTIPVRGVPVTPAWSPDGSRIRFSALDPVSETTVLWEVRRDGSNLHRLPLVPKPRTSLRDGCWTADGRYFIYSEVSGASSSVWIRRENGARQAEPVQLSDNSMSFDLPAPASRGNTVFVRGSISKSGLDRYDEHFGKFTAFWEDVPAVDVSFSRDGSWAAYRSLTDDTLWVGKSSGSERRQLTQPPLRAYQPHWSPDGSRIAFMGQAPNQPSRIYIISVSGGQPQAVQPGDSLDQGVPSWSGDGRYLVFGELLYRHPDDEMSIRLLDLKTRKETVLPGSQAKWAPRWSPDGRYILAVGSNSGSLALFDCARSRWIPLVAANGIDDPVWSLDSRFVHFSALRSGDGGRALFRVNIANDRVERLAPYPAYPASPVRWSGVSSDGSPLVLSSTRIEDIYAIDFK